MEGYKHGKLDFFARCAGVAKIVAMDVEEMISWRTNSTRKVQRSPVFASDICLGLNKRNKKLFN